MNFEGKSNEDIVRDLAAVLAEVGELGNIADEMKAELRRRANGKLGTQRYGDLTLKVGANRRFDAGQAKAVLSPAQYRSILVPTPSSKLAKEMLSPELYRQTMKEHDPKISIAFAEDDDG